MSDNPTGERRIVVRIAKQAIIAALFITAAVAGGISGFLFAYADDLPEISALDNYQPKTITRLLARDGQVVAEFAVERRVVVGYDDIAPVLRQAILASEDADFEQHFGLSISRIVMTAFNDVVYGQRFGASTITQQLARMLFLQEYMQGGVFQRTGMRGVERKIKEMIVAIQIEKRYTKREIFTLYANHVTMGHGAYGLEAGSRLYFDKPAKDLSLEEAATIAAIIQTPARLSPFVNPDQARSRRDNYVLPRMAAEGFISQNDASAAAQRPLVVKGQPMPERSIAPYFAEEIRKTLEQKFGADALYHAGMVVQTTLDLELQEAANRAIDRGLRRIDKRRSSFRKPARNLIAEGQSIEGFKSVRWSQPMAVGDIVPAVVTAAPKRGAGPARLRIGPHEVDLPPAGYAWTRRPAPDALFTVGDVVEVEIRTLRDDVPATVALEQTPILEASLVAIDNRTGEIRAMVGGFSFDRSKFNRATQARRQLGSIFKPIVYTAAIDKGFTPVSIFIDEPVSFEAGPNQPPYAPMNYDRTYEGPTTLRRALEQSRNIPAVKALIEVGPAQVVEYAQRFELGGKLQPYLSLALGSAEATLVDAVSAYSVFPNQGVRMTPYAVTTIVDREGSVLEQNRPQAHETIRADTAFVMTNLLRGVVQRGTGASAASLNWPLAGKTGTVDDYTDTWFIGFDPNITVGVWVGYDEKKPIGGSSNGETGATAALPIWMDFMRTYIDVRNDRKNPPSFDTPGNIAFVTLESGTTEAFINGTQPQTLQTLEPEPPPAEVPATP
ncbi:MAG: PBP1A family penicillin-binding protein [Acidobacteria bacterium]|nr:PBP1A family penicillin-binding protein [Acidobacteriota bacterium]